MEGFDLPTASTTVPNATKLHHRSQRHSNDPEFSSHSRINNKGNNSRTKSMFTTPSIFQSTVFLFLVLVSINKVNGQTNTNILVPEITAPIPPFEEGQLVTLLCKVLTTFTLNPGQTALTWSRVSGMPVNVDEVPSVSNLGTFTEYSSRLSFQPTASDNRRALTCSANVGIYTGAASFEPEIILRPDTPVIDGPDVIRYPEVASWTCQSTGASYVPPNVYFRSDSDSSNGQGVHLYDRVTQQSSISTDIYSNILYTVNVNLTSSLPTTSALYRLVCWVIHEDTNSGYSYTITAEKVISVFFPPVVTKGSQVGDILQCTTETNQDIPCEIASSNPAATSVTWTLNGTVIDTSNGRYTGGTISDPSLRITSVLRSDRGDYVCSASNGEGTGTFTTPTTLDVRYQPTFTYTSGTTFTGTLGSSAFIGCPIESNPAPTTIRWYRQINGVQTFIDIDNDARYSGGTTVNQNYGLTISPLEISDGDGNYYCQAINDVASATGPLVTLVVNTAPGILTPSPNIVANEGNPQTISCIVTSGTNLTSIVWTKGSVTLDTSNAVKYEGGTTINPSLTVFSLVETDAGVYRCIASNAQGTTRSNDISLTVQYLPRLTVSSNDLTAAPSSSVTLSCVVDANPSATQLYWFKDNSRIDSIIDSRYSGGTVNVPSLTITSLTITDSGSYQCGAINSVGTVTSNTVSLEVISIPIVTASLTTPTVTEGSSSVTLVCDVTSNPAADRLEWVFNGNPVNLTTSGLRRYTGGTLARPSLTIFVVEKTDAGFYVCVAYNDEGRGMSLPLSLTVIYLPSISISSASVTGAQQGRITLSCIVDAVPSITSFYWNKNGQRLALTSGKYAGGSLLDQDLTIYNLDVAVDAATYTCVAGNSRGTTESGGIALAVIFETVITVSATVIAKEGDATRTIGCSVSMYPEPTAVSWLKGSTVLDISGNPTKYTLSTSTSSPSLALNDIVKEDAGAYYCRVTNGQETATSSASTLDVYYKPVASVSSPQQVTATLGGSQRLTCAVSGNPAATYTWFKGASKLTETNRSPSISFPSSSDYGTYTCNATNSAGSTTIQFSVTEGDTDSGGAEFGASTAGGDELSLVTIVLVVIIIIIALVAIVLLVLCCFMGGRCSKKAEHTSKVVPSPKYAQGPVKGDGHFGPEYMPTNGSIRVDEEDYTPREKSNGLPRGVIISVPEKSGGRAHHLPPLTENEKAEEQYYREEKRRSRKKNKIGSRKKKEEKKALTGVEEEENDKKDYFRTM